MSDMISPTNLFMMNFIPS